jgi:hypothetical protein
VQKQRAAFAEGSLSAGRQRQLQDLAGWSWTPKADQWEEGFSQLVQYVEHHGDARVPKSYTIGTYKLGMWVRTQRSFYAKGTLDPDRVDRLRNLTGWTWRASSSA